MKRTETIQTDSMSIILFLISFAISSNVRAKGTLMIISIINTTSLHRQEVQDKVRAVNRQLQEDFKPYWHTDVQLRLEGWTGEDIDPDRPINMRGDGVIYLREDDDTGGALGYHDRNYRGVPYGFVHTNLSRCLGEAWSVALSHEALEMALDAEINRLVQGPHPDPNEGGRIVYHWYEVCDAVQTDTYFIDGVEVSNFVLPLYFTSAEEHLNHNDFLGRGVRSFGVRRGGYVGFFDPENERHDMYHRPDDEDAVRRMNLKAEFRDVKRTGRRDGNLGDVLNDPHWVACEAISFELKTNGNDMSLLMNEAQRVVSQHLGGSWKVRVCRGDPKEFDAIHIGSRPLTFADAWQRAHNLETEENVVYAEPSFTFPTPGETDVSDEFARKRFSALSTDHKPKTDKNYKWVLEACNVPAAWKFIEESAGNPGQGVLIGHPDSGFIEHPEMDIRRVRIDFDKDFLEEDEETRTKRIKDGSHGLATASVIMSGLGDEDDKITGPAYCAEILPLRVTKPRGLIPAPVLFSGGLRRLRDAVDYAVQRGCRVISISLGGPPHRGLRKAIQRAKEEGVIICAAAGNVVSFVVWPARYKEVIAVAGCDIDRKPWTGSCRGPSVNVTAPAESVWRATVSEDSDRIVARSSGTSYAVGLTASIAAMWLAHHCKTLAKLRRSDIPGLFLQLLEKTATRDHKLPAEGFGAGIVDAHKLLLESVPDSTSGQEISSLDETADEDILGKGHNLGDMGDTFLKELLSAKLLVDMVDASRSFEPSRRPASQPRYRSVRLSEKLTQHLNNRKLSAKDFFR